MAVILDPWATKATQDVAKAVGDDTNTRVRALQTKVDDIADVVIAKDATVGMVYEPICRYDSENEKMLLKWRDPNNYIVNGYTLARWATTYIVRGENGATPASIEDGTVVATVTTRNQYADTWLEVEDETGTEVYRAFTEATNGKINSSTKGIFKGYVLYGFDIDETDSDEATCVTYTNDCAGFDPLYVDHAVTESDTDATASAPAGSCHWGDWQNTFIMPRPCMLKRDGTVDYYLDPNNNDLKADGETASDIANTSYDGNAMMEFPSIYVKVWREDTTLHVRFANAKIEAGYECYSTLQSDGATNADHFYLPIFEGSNVSNRMRSMKTGAKPWNNSNSTTELAYARNNGTGWSTTTWADEQLMRLLGILVTRRLDMQTAIAGNPGQSTSAPTNNIGTGSKKGLFYGHAGTSAINTKFFGMENWWGHRWRRCQGLNLINGQYYMKLTKGVQDGSAATDFITSDTAADYTAGYIATGVTVATNWSSSFITKLVGGEKLQAAPQTAGGAGSNTTFFCDAAWSSSGVRCLVCGGDAAGGIAAGLFASSLGYAPSYASWRYGASLSYHT